jgi:hypothetical protein
MKLNVFVTEELPGQKRELYFDYAIKTPYQTDKEKKFSTNCFSFSVLI